MNNTFTWSPDELYHHGILGQKWGRRRWQNPDGTLTEAGKNRYGTVEEYNRRTKKIKDMTDRELQLNLERQRKINEYKKLSRPGLVEKALDTAKAISDNRNRRREQALREKELAVKAKESEDAKTIAKYKAKESEQERKTYQTEAKRLESKARVKDARANLRRSRTERKRMSIVQTIMRKRESMQQAHLEYQKNKSNIDRIVAENQGKSLIADQEYWKSEQSRHNATASYFGSKKENNKKK